MAAVKAGNIINEKIPDKLEETQAQSLMKYAGDPHSDEKAFVIKKSDFSPPNKGNLNLFHYLYDLILIINLIIKDSP